MGERLSTQVDKTTGIVKTAGTDKTRIPYIIARLALIAFALLMFFPGVSPTRIVLQAGQSKISATTSLFTNSVSYESLVKGLTRAFEKGWLVESNYKLLYSVSYTHLTLPTMAVV